MRAKRIKVGYVLCYRDPNYTRTGSLLRGLDKAGVEVVKAVNRNRGVLRYLETPFRLAKARLKWRPDVYIVGFRGHEAFWLLYPLMMGRPIIFDEFINTHDWLVNEHKKFREGHWLVKIADSYMRWVMSRSVLILTDTEAHRQLCAKTYQQSAEKIVALPVGADEAVFYPREQRGRPKRRFEVFFYGTMLPLHGLDVILQAIALLASQGRGVHFTLVGGAGDNQMLKTIHDFISANNLEQTVTHYPWKAYRELPSLIAAADLCLGGPFGGTGQAQRVVTGKTYQFMAMGRPTVVGENEASTGLVDKKNCLVVRQKDAKALAETISWASSHQKLLVDIGRHGREYYESHFSSDALAMRLKKMLASLPAAQ